MTEAARRATPRRLRVLAYHGVQDAAAFERHMRIVATEYVPVSAQQVISATRGDMTLPRLSVWVTFDDGEPSVVRNGIPILDRLGIQSTLFVCPGVIGTKRPLWWQLIEECQEAGLFEGGQAETVALTGTMKHVPDTERRERIRQLETAYVRATGRQPERNQLSASDIDAAAAAGHTIANHTWDHPLLDKCAGDVQRNQVVEAHEWLSSILPDPPTVFAYPNGNHASATERALGDLGYRVGLLFDHRLARPDRSPLRMSRLRVGDGVDHRRFRSILAGVHPLVHRLRPGVR